MRTAKYLVQTFDRKLSHMPCQYFAHYLPRTLKTKRNLYMHSNEEGLNNYSLIRAKKKIVSDCATSVRDSILYKVKKNQA
jgi:hypothetical protein